MKKKKKKKKKRKIVDSDFFCVSVWVLLVWVLGLDRCFSEGSVMLQ